MTHGTYSPPAPGLGEQGRVDFEYAVRKGDIVSESLLRVDRALLTQYYRYLRDQDIENPAFETILSNTTEYIEHQLDTINSKSSRENLVDYFRLKMYHALLPAMLYTPMAFDQPKGPVHTAIREKLTDGIYGHVVPQLADALDLYDEERLLPHSAVISQDLKELRGAINEMTALAMFNRPQNQRIIAIPAPLTKDRRHYTDALMYTINDDEEEASVIPLQIKSNPAEVNLNKLPEDGILIVAQHMKNHLHGNGRQFRGARLLIKEIEGEITDEELQELNEIHAQFHQYITAELAYINKNSQQ